MVMIGGGGSGEGQSHAGRQDLEEPDDVFVCLLSLSHAGPELRDVLANPPRGSSQPRHLQCGLD